MKGKSRVEEAMEQAQSSKEAVSFFKIRTADDVEMDAWMVKPKSFNPEKKYPVVFYVYTEPAGQTVVDGFGVGNNHLYKGNMAEDGYIYVSVDNRGTPAPKGREKYTVASSMKKVRGAYVIPLIKQFLEIELRYE